MQSEWIKVMRARIVGLSLAALGGAVTVGTTATRAWLINWGATGDEIDATLSGDERISKVATQGTMAITIDAPPEAVWPWLVQMGVDRGGLYSYLFVENTLLRLGVTNADRIVPEWQKRELGEIVWLGAPEHWSGNAKQIVAAIEPESHYIMTGEEDWKRLQAGGTANGTWGFILERLAENRSRLIARSRYSAPPPGFELVHFIMERKMLLRLKELAEGQTGQHPS